MNGICLKQSRGLIPSPKLSLSAPISPTTQNSNLNTTVSFKVKVKLKAKQRRFTQLTVLQLNEKSLF